MTTNLIILNATNGSCFVLPLFIIGIFGFCVLLVSLTSPIQRRRQLRKQFKQKKQEYLSAEETYLEKVKNGFYGDTFPNWAVQSVQKFSTKLVAQKKKFTPNQEFFDTFDKESDIHIMENFLEDLSNYTHFLISFLGEFSKIESEIERVQYSIEQTVAHIQQRLDGLNTSLLEHQKTGYILQKYNVQYVLMKTEFSQIKALQQSRPSGDKEIELSLEDLLERTAYLEQELFDFVQYHSKTETLVSELQDRYLSLHPLKEAATNLITTVMLIKSVYPEYYWKREIKNFNKIPSLLKEYMDFIKIAQEQNSMNTQNFEFAYKAAQTAEEKLQLMEQYVADIYSFQQKITEAESNYPILLTSVSQTIVLATTTVRPDDNEEMKQLLEQADRQLLEIITLSSQPLVDWLALGDMLREVKTIAEQCIVQ